MTAALPRSARRLPQSLKLLARGQGVASLLDHCHSLLGESGISIGVALAKQTLGVYERLDREQRKEFFRALLSSFSPDPTTVLAAARRYAEDGSPKHLWALEQAAEAPRQELLRRLNRAPGGTAAILRMREHLLDLVREEVTLEAVDLDFHHLLSSWFNPGFLQLIDVSWRSPAELIERIVRHERVHEIKDWQDLRHRLQGDRRCFAFLHPALPDEPLIFVEVALTDDMPQAIAPLLDASFAPREPRDARVAVFYSISNCQGGLRGVSLGNFLIKQVVDRLYAEFPRLNRFCTLSPAPGFSRWLQKLAIDPANAPKGLANSLARVAEKVNGDFAALGQQPVRALEVLESVKNELLELSAEYFLGNGGEETPDPVARFHLSNGARLERLNWAANPSRRGIQESLGIMVNYLYNPERLERNHELFVGGRNAASPAVNSLRSKGAANGRSARRR